MTDWPIFDCTSKTFPLCSPANVGENFPDPITPLNTTAGFRANLEPGWQHAFFACWAWEDDLYDKSVEKNVLLDVSGDTPLRRQPRRVTRPACRNELLLPLASARLAVTAPHATNVSSRRVGPGPRGVRSRLRTDSLSSPRRRNQQDSDA